MKQIFNYTIAIALLFAFSICANAQVKAGDIISGNVSDDIEPLMMVNVVEIDANKRIVAHGVTDINGNFSFKCANPKDHLQVSYVGYATFNSPINKKTFKIVLKSNTMLGTVEIKAVKKTQNTVQSDSSVLNKSFMEKW